jgi:hypothetical protein
MKQADQRVRGDPDGETAAALVHARGAKTHILEDFGRLTDTYGDAYRAYYGVWRWQDYSDPRARFAPREPVQGPGSSGRAGARAVPGAPPPLAAWMAEPGVWTRARG